MALPDLAGIADAAAAVATAKAVTIDGRPLKVYATEPRVFDTLPALSVRLDTFSRRGIDDGDLELGVALWDLTYEVVLEVPMPEPDQGQRDMHSVLAQVIDAFDDSPTLGRVDVDDAVLESGQQLYVTGDNSGQQRVRFECALTVRARST